MKSASEYNITVVSLQGNSLCKNEINILHQGFGCIEFIEIPACETSRGIKSFLRSAISLQGLTSRVAERIREGLTPETDVILVYGDELAEAAICAVHETGIPVIMRLEKASIPFERAYKKLAAVIVTSTFVLKSLESSIEEGKVKALLDYPVIEPLLSTARFHTVDSHALTFVSQGAIENSFQLVKAMAIARPGSQVRWICLGECIPAVQENELPANLSFETYPTLYDAVEREPVDWFITLDEKPAIMPHVILQSLSAGVPVIAIESPLIEEVVTDECGVLFGSDPQSEEFIKGLFPYVESDFRMSVLREGALNRWSELFSPEKAGSRLIETICLCLDQQ